MMKHILLPLTAMVLACATTQINAQEKANEKQPSAEQKQVDIAKVSEAFGHLIGKNIETTGVKFDIAQVIKGLQDASKGVESPLSEAECIQAITAVQEQLFKEQAESNLKKAQEFLSTNLKDKNVVTLEEGKVQYKVEKEGTGAPVESHYSPLIHYTGKFLDGAVFGSSKEDEMVSLDEIIPGLKAGLVGMKEGEKRTIYIHPDMAYGTSGYLPPNSLLTFEIEVVKANSPQQEQADASPSAASNVSSEIAEPETHVR